MSVPENIGVSVAKRSVTVIIQPLLTERNEWDESAATSKVELVLRPRYPTRLPTVTQLRGKKYTLDACTDCPLQLDRLCGGMVIKPKRPLAIGQPLRFGGSVTIQGDANDEDPTCIIFNDHTLEPIQPERKK